MKLPTPEVVKQCGVHAEQRRLAGGIHRALLCGQQARDSAEQGGLAGAIPSDDADNVAVVDHKRDAADRVDFPDRDPALPPDQPHQRGRRGALVAARAIDAVDHVEIVDHDGRVSHGATH
jgi:hypothetical protein